MNLRRIIIFALLIALLLAAYIAWNKKSSTTTTKLPGMNEYTIDNIKVQTEIPEEFTRTAVEFLKRTTKESSIPSELTLPLQNKGDDQNGPAYIGNWNKDGQFFSFLVGLTTNSKAINYMRIWVMPQSTPVTAKEANAHLSAIFLQSYLSQFGEISCSAPQNTEKLTECGKMKTDEAGNLLGVTVRSPITLVPPQSMSSQPEADVPTVTIISACFIPKDGTPVYSASLCL